MKDFIKNKAVTGVVVITTIILAGVAIFTAIKLYQTGSEPVAPNVPESEPAAGSPPQACSALSFSLEEETPTTALTPTTAVVATLTPTTSAMLTPTVGIGGGETPTLTPTAVPTATPTTRLTSSPTPMSTTAPTPTDEPLGIGGTSPTSTMLAEASPTTALIAQQTSPAAGGAAGGAADDQLPAAGVGMPTILAGILGVLLLMFSIALAF